MKWNWGYSIGTFYVVFVLALAWQLYRSFQYDRSLVVEDYYAKDLKYQEQYDRLENSLKNKADLKVTRGSDSIKIQFPEGHSTPQGEIHFYRPDKQSLDRKYPIALDDQGIITIPTSDLVSGKWKIKATWNWESLEYYVEKETVIP